jgi:thiol-disulfide isomerase/thioredoxin
MDRSRLRSQQQLLECAMPRIVTSRSVLMWLAVLLLLALAVPRSVATGEVTPPRPLPEFTTQSPGHWIQSRPLSVRDLRGKVLLIDVWTFECWNCYRSFPWLNALAARMNADEFEVIGIHSPEYASERQVAAVRAKAVEFGLRHPIMIDNDLRYWAALENRFWPAYYLVDRQGRIRYRFVGETHAGGRQAVAVESAIQKLLAEDR